MRYVWASPDGEGWIDAWNGWYPTEGQALDEGKAGLGTPRVLRFGEGLVDEDEMVRRLAAGGVETEFPAKADPTPVDVPGLKRLAFVEKVTEFWLDDDPDHIRSDNTRRASFAAHAVAAYADHTGNGGEEPATMLRDLFGDLMHLCDLLDVGFDDMVDLGLRHYDAELRGEL